MATAKKNDAPKVAEEDFTSLEGHDLLRDPSAIRPSEALRLSTIIAAAQDDDGSMDVGKFADVVAYIEDTYVINVDDWQALYRRLGLAHMTSLVASWVGEMLAGGR